MTEETTRLPLTAESIYNQAREACQATGQDVWDHYKMEGLQALLESFKKEANASPEIEAEFRNYCVGNVAKGIIINSTLASTPDIEKKKIEKPLFIIGMPRTGTTLLHYLMGEDPMGRALLGWETYTCPVPLPHPSTHKTDPRVEGFRAGMEEFYKKIPNHKATHHVQSDAPEECIGLFAIQFHAHMEFAKYNIPSYAEWLIHRDMRPAYAFYKKELQCLSYHFPDGPHWILKAPFHLYFLDALTHVFPDACFVQTHRDLKKVVPSGVSLTHQLRSYYSPTPKEELGDQILNSMSEMADIGIRHREKLDPKQFIDLSYDELTGDPIQAVKRIYDHFGYPFTAEFEERLQQRVSKSPKDKHGVHKYTMEEYGLSPEKINKAFKFYNETFAAYL